VALIDGLTKDLTAKVHVWQLIPALAKQCIGFSPGRRQAGLGRAVLQRHGILEKLPY